MLKGIGRYEAGAGEDSGATRRFLDARRDVCDREARVFGALNPILFGGNGIPWSMVAAAHALDPLIFRT